MIMDRTFKPEKAVGKDKMREAMMHVLFEGGYIVATEGHCMVIGTQNHQQEPRLVSVESLQYARKQNKNIDPIMVFKDKHDEHVNGVTFPKPSIGADKYPRWKKVIPREKADYTMHIDMRILNKVADALGTHSLAVEIINKDDKSPGLRIFGEFKTDRFAIMMLRSGMAFNRNEYFTERNIEVDNE